MLNTNTSLLQKVGNTYLFGQQEFPVAEKAFDVREFYDIDELSELELEHYEPDLKDDNPLANLNMDWDTFPGSMRNSAASVFDAFFSSIGTKFAQNLGAKSKLAMTLGTYLISKLGNTVKIPFISKEISMFNYAGRLLRAPLHIFDSVFSVLGESWSDSGIANFATMGLSTLGLSNSFNKAEGLEGENELDYQTINGTLGRSSLHSLNSLISSFAQNIYKFSPALGAVATASLTAIGLNLPKELKEHNLSWKSLDGLLAQNLFHFSDSLYAGLGSSLSKMMSKNKLSYLALFPVLIGSTFVDKFKGLMSKKLVFTEVNAKVLRSAVHSLDTLVFNLGTELAKTKFALPFIGLYSLISSSALLDKKILPDIKVPMNTLGGLIQRLPLDFVESMISATSNQLGQKIPSPVLALLGPALSFKFGNLAKNAKTTFNTSNGLLLKHLIHFWDNLLTSSGYKLGSSLMDTLKLGANKEYSGSLLSDGRWMTSEGRILSRMALGKQLV